jgi:acetyltransferase-like isoleucine patch superfamily enzyme
MSTKSDHKPLDPLYQEAWLYRQWLNSGAKGRLHLTEPDGLNICSVLTGKGLERLKTYWRRFCLMLAHWFVLNFLKIFFLRQAGLTIGQRVFIAHGARFDWKAPWLINLEDGCLIGYNALICSHLYSQGKLVVRKIVIGREAVVGVRATVAASMGEQSILYTGSVLLSDAPPHSLMCGVPAVAIDWTGQPI